MHTKCRTPGPRLGLPSATARSQKKTRKTSPGECNQISGVFFVQLVYAANEGGQPKVESMVAVGKTVVDAKMKALCARFLNNDDLRFEMACKDVGTQMESSPDRMSIKVWPGIGRPACGAGKRGVQECLGRPMSSLFGAWQM